MHGGSCRHPGLKACAATQRVDEAAQVRRVMTALNKLSRVLPLVGISVLEMSVSFVRMFVLTRLLGGYEFGFASALSASYAVLEQMTDLAVYRFVLSTKQDLYEEALAIAHAVSILRGLVVAAAFGLLSEPIACALTSCANWPSFAALALLPLIRGFEHLEVRIGERHYRFRPILLALAVSHAIGLVAMVGVAGILHSHVAFIAYMVVQSTIYLAMTQRLARTPYRVRLRSPLTRGALTFSLPLLLNGFGLAVYTQGDRLLVGATLGVEALGHYAVMILIAIVPISALTKVVSAIHFAGLHNADDADRFAVRRRLYARSMPIIAACYAVLLGGTLKTVMPLAFGPRFTVSDTAVLLISLVAFFRASRADPMTTLLLHAKSTTRLAASSQAPFLGLAAAAILVHLYPSLDAILSGVLLGEVATLGSLLVASRHVFGPAIRDYLATEALMLMLVLCAVAPPLAAGVREALGGGNLVTVLILVVIALTAKVALSGLLRQGYGRRARPAPA
ncbi:lipopolysaccharide biosynthesis protein [Methylobacterium sp. A54F]